MSVKKCPIKETKCITDLEYFKSLFKGKSVNVSDNIESVENFKINIFYPDSKNYNFIRATKTATLSIMEALALSFTEALKNEITSVDKKEIDLYSKDNYIHFTIYTDCTISIDGKIKFK